MVKAKWLPIVLDIAGSTPGFGNLFSGAAARGNKVIPVVGTLVSLGFLAYDVAGPNDAISTYQQCMAGPG